MEKVIEEYDLMLAGTQYDNRYYNSEGSRKGSKFDLEIEPDNPVDPLAILVKYNAKNIGYVPKDENLEIAYYLSHPEWFLVDCRQKKKIDNDRNYETIVVIIYIYAVSENYEPFSFEKFDEEFPNYDEDVEKLKRKIEFEKKQKEQISLEQTKKRLETEKAQKERDERGCFTFYFIIFIIIILFVIFMCS